MVVSSSGMDREECVGGFSGRLCCRPWTRYIGVSDTFRPHKEQYHHYDLLFLFVCILKLKSVSLISLNSRVFCLDFLMTFRVCVSLSSFLFPASVMYNLDEDESQGGIAINLLPLMTQDQQHKTDTTQPAGVKKERSLLNTLC